MKMSARDAVSNWYVLCVRLCVFVCERERGGERVCVCACVCLCECVCVCVHAFAGAHVYMSILGAWGTRVP